MLPKAAKTIFERLVNGYTEEVSRMTALLESELLKMENALRGAQEELLLKQKKVKELEDNKRKEQNYMDDLFSSISDTQGQISRFEASKTIQKLIEEAKLNDEIESYSGVNYFLRDICLHLSNMAGHSGEISTKFEGASEHVLRGMRIELEDRYRNI